jgi:hypothetical protein
MMKLDFFMREPRATVGWWLKTSPRLAPWMERESEGEAPVSRASVG